MLEERLILIISYADIAALLLVFCFYTNFSKKVKLISIFAVSLFYISSWKGYVGVLGWPTSEELPDDFNILWVVIQEPNKSRSNEGELFLWVKEIDELKKPIGDPRAFNLKSYDPKTILLNSSNNPTNLKLRFNENVKGINCFDNSGGKWRNTKINFVSQSEIDLIFDLPFKKRRGRVNCTMPAANGLIKWFGYQYSVVN